MRYWPDGHFTICVGQLLSWVGDRALDIMSARTASTVLVLVIKGRVPFAWLRSGSVHERSCVLATRILTDTSPRLWLPSRLNQPLAKPSHLEWVGDRTVPPWYPIICAFTPHDRRARVYRIIGSETARFLNHCVT